MAAETKSKNENKSFIANIGSYLSEVRSELNKVTWPTREDIIRLTRVVLLVTLVSSLFLGLLSVGMTIFLDQIGFEFPIILVILFIAIAIGTWWSFRQGESKSY